MNTGQKTMQNGSALENAVAKSEGWVGQYPLSSVLAVFGIGLGVGVVVGSILGAPVMPRPSFGQRTELAAEKLGRQMLDAIAGVLPESLAKHISSH